MIRRPIMKTSLLALVLGMTLQPVYASKLSGETVGEAFDLITQQPLYSETHCVSDDALLREVSYRDGDQTLIAFKTLSYETGMSTPAFEQRNIDSQNSVGVEVQQGEVVMTFTEADTKAPRVVSKKPASGIPLVVDAGFDAFVKDNWESLLSGENKRFQFPFAGRETVVELEITRSDCTYESQTDQCFSLELSNWFFKMLAAPIELGYDKELRRLSRFRGVSNITDEDGGGLVVDIRYRYTDVASIDCAPEELSAILAALTNGRPAHQRR